MITWDEAKRASNLAKHGLDFADSVQFDFDTALLEIDDRGDYGECREIATLCRLLKCCEMLHAPRRAKRSRP